MVVRDVLGNERTPDKVWDDGSYTCPFCFAAARVCDNGCPNPGCHANPAYPIDRALADVARLEAAAKEAKEREATRVWRERYHREREQETADRRKEIEAECATRGACVRCALQPGWEYKPAHYIKHRKTCPHTRTSM
jgi:hypothetical protein